MTADLFGDLGAMGTSVPESFQNESKTIASTAEAISDCNAFDEIHSSTAAALATMADDSKMIAAGAVESKLNSIKLHESIDAKSPAAIKFDCMAMPSMERIHVVLAAHGVDPEGLPTGLLAAVAQLVTEAQAAPADLPPADRVLCWVMDSDLAKFAPMRVRRALAELGTNNGERMIPLYAPAPCKGD